jgi:hypothetical protein
MGTVGTSRVFGALFVCVSVFVFFVLCVCSLCEEPAIHSSLMADARWEAVLDLERSVFKETNGIEAVEAMMPVPVIQDTGTNLTAEVSLPSASAVGTAKKKKKKTLWTYVTVAEPTGVSSTYWDVEKTQERRARATAKLRLSALTGKPSRSFVNEVKW